MADIGGKENRIIQERLLMLRNEMRNAGIDYYMIPTADFHGSEYVSDYFKVREYFSGFTGSNGTLLVWREGAGLWTDGRYFIQAERELDGTGIELFRMLEEGVPSLEEFLADKMQDGQVLGFDGRVISAAGGIRLEKKFEKQNKNIQMRYDRDLADKIWIDRPAFPAGKVNVLEERIAGKSVEEKLAEVREKMREAGADGFLLTKLDDLMWLFNVRGCDVECNPVAMSYGYITLDLAVLFLREQEDTENNPASASMGEKPCDTAGKRGQITEYLTQKEITLEKYDNIVTYLEKLSPKRKILVDKRYCSYLLYRLVVERHIPVEQHNPTELMKAVKNGAELANMEKIYRQDSVALTRFIYWLKQNIGKMEITELDAADQLEKFRRKIPEFLDLSFPTIAAYGPNAAMMHYEATEENHAVLKPEGLFLVDSGGQYLGGTTDVTRTVALGELTDEMKMHYTLVAAGMLELSHARWLHGCTGRNLDLLARKPLWDIGIDYKCGTGHGVGYILNVHEGPQNMRWRFTEGQTEAVIEEGMDITNEPGVYIEGSHGIRIENVMVAKNDVKNEYGQFMHFETLTWVPLDRAAIDEKYLTEAQKGWLWEYQQKVYEKLSPYLDEAEREWLREETHSLIKKL